MKVRASSHTANYTPVRVVKACRQCGEWFIGTPCGVYCSNECCTTYSQKHRKPRTGKRAGGKRTPRGPFVCEYCNKEYMTQRPEGEGERYCTRECSFADRHRNAKSSKYTLIYYLKCSNCSKKFIDKCKHKKCCSIECSDEWAANSSRNRSKEQHNKTGKVTLCAICGINYCLVYGAISMKYCSTECYKQSDAYANEKKHKRISIHQYHARQRGRACEQFDPFDIFDRDHWRCQACGVNTPKRLRGTYKDNAPELDHIIPLSKGGSHIRTNVRLCCRRCNIMKSNGSLNDQLLLIG